MLSYVSNQHIKEKLQFSNTGEILFLQKIKELLHNNSGVSYSYKIHNAYSILMELKSVIIDWEFGRTNGFIVEELRREAFELLQHDLVMPISNPTLYGVICEEIKKGLSIDRNNQNISVSDIDRVRSIYRTICNLEKTYEIMSYLNDTLNLLKCAVDQNEPEKILDLTECTVSSIIVTKRSISSIYNSIIHYFEKSNKPFDDCWKQWVGSVLLVEAKYVCYFKVEERYKDKITNLIVGTDLIQKYSEALGSEKIDIDSSYFEVSIETPANDYAAIIEKSLYAYKTEMGIVEFATGKVNQLVDSVLVYDIYFHKFLELSLKRNETNIEYKPYNQYHKNIDSVVRKFIEQLNSTIDKNKLINAIINMCNFEEEGKSYNFLLSWSSLEALFRSNQYPNAISAIKDIVPNILSHRYIYYRLYDLLKECKNVGIEYQYKGKQVIGEENPSEEQIKLLFAILRDDTEKQLFLQKCKNAYELLYYRGKELEQILLNSQTVRKKIEHHRDVLSYQLQRMYRIRNKFVHHSIIDENIDVLCKHIRVYLWEAIREMSYVAVKRNVTTLEELYSYFRMNNLMMKKTLINSNVPLEEKHILGGYL